MVSALCTGPVRASSSAPLRRTVPFVRTGDRALPSLGLAAAMIAAGLGPADVSMIAIAGARPLRRVHNTR
jgi:hypothetical protein